MSFLFLLRIFLITMNSVELVIFFYSFKDVIPLYYHTSFVLPYKPDISLNIPLPLCFQDFFLCLCFQVSLGYSEVWISSYLIFFGFIILLWVFIRWENSQPLTLKTLLLPLSSLLFCDTNYMWISCFNDIPYVFNTSFDTFHIHFSPSSAQINFTHLLFYSSF